MMQHIEREKEVCQNKEKKKGDGAREREENGAVLLRVKGKWSKEKRVKRMIKERKVNAIVLEEGKRKVREENIDKMIRSGT